MNVNALAADLRDALAEHEAPPAIVLVINESGGISMLGFGFQDEADITDTFRAIAAKAVEAPCRTVN